MALIYYEQKRYEEAIGKFEELLETHPEDDRIIYYLGVIDENLKRDSRAEGQFIKIKAGSNFFKDARLHMAYLKVRAGKIGRASCRERGEISVAAVSLKNA